MIIINDKEKEKKARQKLEKMSKEEIIDRFIHDAFINDYMVKMLEDIIFNLEQKIIKFKKNGDLKCLKD